MPLLSDSQISGIKNALKQVTDQFMSSPVVYRLFIDSVDRFQEDRGKTVSGASTNYDLLGLVEYSSDDKDKTDTSPVGAVDDSEVQVSFNLQDLDDLGLIDANNVPIMRSETDEMVVKGVEYKVTQVVTDGPLDNKPILVIVYGTKKFKRS